MRTKLNGDISAADLTLELDLHNSGNTSAIGGLAHDFCRRIYRACQKPEAWTWQRREDFEADGEVLNL